MRNKISKAISLLSALGVLFFLSLSAVAYEDETIGKAEKSYQEGYSAFEKQLWWEATENFNESHSYIPIPRTAFYLSASYMELSHPEGALKFAQLALSGKPPLEERYRNEFRLEKSLRKEARKIVVWANKEIKARKDSRQDVEFNAKADNPLRKFHKPPKLRIPRKTTLGIARRSKSPKRPVSPPADYGKKLPPGSPKILAFSATSYRIRKGESVSFSWQTSNADLVLFGYADPKNPTAIVKPRRIQRSGSLEHRPQKTATYRLKASKRGRSVSRQVTVRVIW